MPAYPTAILPARPPPQARTCTDSQVQDCWYRLCSSSCTLIAVSQHSSGRGARRVASLASSSGRLRRKCRFVQAPWGEQSFRMDAAANAEDGTAMQASHRAGWAPGSCRCCQSSPPLAHRASALMMSTPL